MLSSSTPTRLFRQEMGRFLAIWLSVVLSSGCGSGGGTALVTERMVSTTRSRDFIEETETLAIQDHEFVLTEARTMDGTLNNSAGLGSTGSAFVEDSGGTYADGAQSPSAATRPSPRAVSNAVAAQTESLPDPGGRTAFLWAWGQFIDHDISLTLKKGDATVSDQSRGAPMNSLTSFIDASMVYGFDDQRALALRTLAGGKLATSTGDLPPFNTEGLENAGGTGADLFVCGDIRANENVLLTSLHTVFLREHNRLATKLQSEFPELTDEELYQGARKRVGALIQSITYNEYLPALLGPGAVPGYAGYLADVDPRVGILFATAAHRLASTQTGKTIARIDEDGRESAEGNLNVADAFFNPAAVSESGVEPLLRGAASEPAQRTDPRIIDDLRELTFGPPGPGGLDLASLHIQRGRDQGLPDYNTIRREYGLPLLTNVSEITADTQLQRALTFVYESVNEIDPWVGLLSEDPVPGAVVGPTLHRILSSQFQKLRDGDRFYFLNDPDLAEEVSELGATRLSKVIARNTGIVGLQNNVFFEARNSSRATPRRILNRVIPMPSL